MPSLQSAFGIFAILAIAWLFSEHRRMVAWKQAGLALVLTLITAVILLKVPQVVEAFSYINRAVEAIAAATRAGTSFVFGYLGGGTLPYELKTPGADFVLALQALPVLLVMSVITTLLFYWGLLPPVVRAFAWALQRTIGVGGAVGLSTAANIFVGHVEAPLFIRPYLARLTRTELFIVMTGGMAGIAGTVLVLYATMLGPIIPNAAAHLVICSVLGAPAAILISLIMVPEKAPPSPEDEGATGVSNADRFEPAPVPRTIASMVPDTFMSGSSSVPPVRWSLVSGTMMRLTRIAAGAPSTEAMTKCAAASDIRGASKVAYSTSTVPAMPAMPPVITRNNSLRVIFDR